MPGSIEYDERIIDVVADALPQPPEERELFVSATGNGDEALHRAVMDALADEEKMGAFLSAPWIEFTRRSSPFACGEIIAEQPLGLLSSGHRKQFFVVRDLSP